MTTELKDYLKKSIDLIDEELYDELYSNCDATYLSELTEFLLSCSIKPDEYMIELPPYYLFGSKLTNYDISSSIIKIGHYAFAYSKSLTAVTIPNGVVSIDNSAFSGCTSLTSIKMLDGVEIIGESAFNMCSKISSITIPDSIKTIGYGAFLGCDHLTSITYNGTVEQWKSIDMENNVFDGVPTSVVRCTDGVTRTQ